MPDDAETLSEVAQQTATAAAGFAAFASAAANMAFATVQLPAPPPLRHTNYSDDPVTVDGVTYRQLPSEPYDTCSNCTHPFHGFACFCGCQTVNGVMYPAPSLLCVHCDRPLNPGELKVIADFWVACKDGCDNAERGTE